MEAIALPVCVAFALALALTPGARRLGAVARILDWPDSTRKTHPRRVPRSGGVAILVAYFTAFLLASPATALTWLPGVAIVFAIGLVDDLWDLRPRNKLVGELAGAACLYANGVRIEIVSLPSWCGFCATVLWLVLCANAVNLIDGSDGVAAGVCATAASSLAVSALLTGDPVLLAAAAPLAAALLGFLAYNVHPATIFAGDCGSLTVGVILGACAARSAGGATSIAAFAASAYPLALPLFEVALSVTRRFLRNRPIFEADRRHIHHRLLDRGFTPRAVAVTLSAATAYFGMLALAAGLAPLVSAMLFGAGVWTGARYLAYAEFRAAIAFCRHDLRGVVSGRITIEELQTALRSPADLDACWRAIAGAAQSLGYGRIEARLGGRQFAGGMAGHTTWHTRVALPDGDYVEVAHVSGYDSAPQAHGAFIAALRDLLPWAIAGFSAIAARQPDPNRDRVIRWKRPSAELSPVSGD